MREKHKMPKIVVTQPVHAEVLQTLQAAGEVVMNPGPEPWSDAERQQHLTDAHAMMAFMTDRVDQSTLLDAPRLRTIACALKGYDNFDLAACAAAGVSVSFVPDLLTEPTAELAVGLAIAAARHVLPGDAGVRAGYAGWRPTLYGTGLHGSVVTVVGLGAVGRAIVDRLAGFGCADLLGVDPQRDDARVRRVRLEEALATSDYLLLATPLTPTTRHLIDDAALGIWPACERARSSSTSGVARWWTKPRWCERWTAAAWAPTRLTSMRWKTGCCPIARTACTRASFGTLAPC
jgi:phosphonate dehydrogenase